MQAKELRIGNYVEQGIYGFQKCTAIQIARFEANQLNKTEADYYNHWKPIHLTEEILLKCGFELDSKKVYWQMKGCDLFLEIMQSKEWFSHKHIGFNLSHRGVTLIEINHLHQLQNLYFALTGEELEINL